MLTSKTLNVRLNTLQDLGLFHTVDGRLELALRRMGKDVSDVETFLQEVVEERYMFSWLGLYHSTHRILLCSGEGLVLKRGISGYHLGGRESKWWVKVSPQ